MICAIASIIAVGATGMAVGATGDTCFTGPASWRLTSIDGNSNVEDQNKIRHALFVKHSEAVAKFRSSLKNEASWRNETTKMVHPTKEALDELYCSPSFQSIQDFGPIRALWVPITPGSLPNSKYDVLSFSLQGPMHLEVQGVDVTDYAGYSTAMVKDKSMDRVIVTIPCGSLPTTAHGMSLTMRDDGIRTSIGKPKDTAAYWTTRAEGYERFGPSFVTYLDGSKSSDKHIGIIEREGDGNSIYFPLPDWRQNCDHTRDRVVGGESFDPEKVLLRGPPTIDSFQVYRMVWPTKERSDHGLPFESLEGWLEKISLTTEGELKLTFLCLHHEDEAGDSVPIDRDHESPEVYHHQHLDNDFSLDIAALGARHLPQAPNKLDIAHHGLIETNFITWIAPAVAVLVTTTSEAGVGAEICGLLCGL